MYALNFYSPIVEGQLRSGRKSATIRLGDKSGKYRKGMIVAVLAGRPLRPADEGLRRGHRQGRGEAARRAVPERDRARQPGDPPGRGHGAVPGDALQPRGQRERPRHADPFQRDPARHFRSPVRADLDAELLVRPQLAAALLALDRERRREAARRRPGSASGSRRRTAGRRPAAPPPTPRSSAGRTRSRGRRRPSRRAPCGAPRAASPRPCSRGHCSPATVGGADRVRPRGDRA